MRQPFALDGEIKSQPIAVQNDLFRLRCASPDMALTALKGQVVLTSGIGSLAIGQIEKIMQEVASFDRFSAENDPYGHHDFGCLEVRGLCIYWKIDCYADEMCDEGSEDPANPDTTYRILTIMLPDEY